MEPLTLVAARCRVDYFKARNLVIQGLVNGIQVNGKWMCEAESLSAWKAREVVALRARLAEVSDPAPAA